MLPTAGDSLISNLFYMKGNINWIGIKFKLLCMEVGDQATKRREHNPVFKDGIENPRCEISCSYGERLTNLTHPV